jgi:hypothetical protein
MSKLEISSYDCGFYDWWNFQSSPSRTSNPLGLSLSKINLRSIVGAGSTRDNSERVNFTLFGAFRNLNGSERRFNERDDEDRLIRIGISALSPDIIVGVKIHLQWSRKSCCGLNKTCAKTASAGKWPAECQYSDYLSVEMNFIERPPPWKAGKETMSIWIPIIIDSPKTPLLNLCLTKVCSQSPRGFEMLSIPYKTRSQIIEAMDGRFGNTDCLLFVERAITVGT